MKKHALRWIILLVFFTGQWVLGLGQPVKPAYAQSEKRLDSLLLVDEPETLPVGEKPVINLKLVNAINRRAIPNKVVVLYIDDQPIRQIRTGENGSATLKITQDLPAGNYRVRVSFGGTSAYNGTSTELQLTIRPAVLSIQTIPSLPGITFTMDGKPFVVGEDGFVHIEVPRLGTYRVDVKLPENAATDPNYQIRFERWGDDKFQAARQVEINGDQTLQAGFALFHTVSMNFHDLEGAEVKQERVDTLTLKSSFGAQYTLEDGRPYLLQANRVARRKTGLEATPVQYAVENVVIDGTNVVNQAQQRYLVSPGDVWQVELLLYYARIQAKDALFGTPIGEQVMIEYPSGRQEIHPFGPQDKLTLGPLARGLYTLQVLGVSGMAPRTPVALSRDQDVELKVLTSLDITLGISAGILGALGLLLYGRPQILRRLRRKPVVIQAAVALVFLTVQLLGQATRAQAAGSPPSPDPSPKVGAQVRGDALQSARNPIPLMAYYYIWFNPQSWERAKKDYPTLGRYSSDDRAVMEQHIRWAKAVGIEGFIVSWKSTLQLDRRLELLMDVAAANNFHLWIIYQGLDFDRKPLPVEQIEADFEYFVKNYASHPAFSMYDRPVVIWSGTWEFSPEEVKRVTEPYRQQLMILASERNVKGYQRLAGLVEGNAYYWSSVNPATYPDYQGKLDEMSQAVHSGGGLWVAPAAPGFDAQMLGGKTVVDRNNGDTLRTQFQAASRSNPDVIGLISWNEFSENSHIEPSEQYGTQALDVIADIQDGAAPVVYDFDSSAPGTTAQNEYYPIYVLIGLSLFILGCIGVVLYRR